MKHFLNVMAEILEVNVSEISLDTKFRDNPDWGSMMGFSILIQMEQEYKVKISVPEFLEMETLGDIYAKIRQ